MIIENLFATFSKSQIFGTILKMIAVYISQINLGNKIALEKIDRD